MERNKRYKKLKQCNLPYSFWDKKRDTFEWVYYDELKPYGYDIKNSLYEALRNISSSGVTYHYEAYVCEEMDTEQEPKYQWIESHCHSFDELIECLYDSPESFRIPEKYLEEYSKQELRCLNKLQSYRIERLQRKLRNYCYK